MTFPKIRELLLDIATGTLTKGGLPGVLGALLGGDVKAKVLKAARAKMDAQEARTAGKELAFGSHKFISAVAGAAPAAERGAVTMEAARVLAAQYVDLAEEILAFAPLAIEREELRGRGDAQEKAALEAREAGETRVLQQGVDIGRVANGDAPKMGAVA